MSQVRRCDYEGCTNGPAGTRAVSDVANPAGWVTAHLTAQGTLAGSVLPGGGSIQGDYDSPLCAALALFEAEPTVAVGEPVPEPPPAPEPEPPRKRTRAKA